MFVEIITPETNLYSGEAEQILLPGIDGSLGLLNRHAPLITSLRKGVVKVIKNSGETLSLEVNGGTVEVLNNKVIILAD